MQSQKRKEGSKAGEVVQSKKSRKKKAQISADLEEERRLTALLFGTSTSASASSLPIRAVDGDAGGRDASGLRSYDKSALESHFKSQGTRTNDLGDDGDDASRPLFEIDRAGVPEPSGMQGLREKSRQMDPKVNEDVSGTSDHDEDGDRSIGSLNPAEAAPAWQDDDDENVQVNLMESSMRLRKLRTSQSEAVDALPGRDLEARLRNRFQSTAELTARTDWARVNDRAVGDDNENADGTPESSSLSLFGGPSIGRKLPGGAINMVRCRDANQSDPNRSVVQAVHFHPASDAANPLLLTAGLDKTLRFFQVGVEKSTKVHGIHCTSSLVFELLLVDGELSHHIRSRCRS